MKHFVYFLFGAVLPFCGTLSAADGDFSAIVKIETVACRPDFISPWANKPQTQSSGTGVVIADNKILTNAHNVADATYISVSKNNDGFPVSAKVAAVNHECDLALLEVADKSFFDGIEPMQLGDTPPIQSIVLAVGYPIGGAEISATQGIVSRIECVRYAHSLYGYYLAAQLDAAINPGNSGGPIIYDGKVVGIAFQVNSEGDGIGYMIHSDVIKHFLRDAEDGKIDGFGVLGLQIMCLTNPDARASLHMGGRESGVLVCELSPFIKAEPALRVNDVITAIDGFKIMNNANIRNERGENADFGTIADRKQMGETINLSVLRDGKTFECKIKLVSQQRMITPHLYDKRPRYVIVGGFVFTELSLDYMEDCGDDVPPEFMSMLDKDRQSADSEVIVLSQVLGDDVNVGYQGMHGIILESFNGKKIKNLDELAAAADAANDGYIVMQFEGKEKVILDAKRIRAAMPDILKRYNVPRARN